jgi:hypothetical protein
MVIAFSGSRFLNPATAAPIIRSILQSAPAGTRFAVGCCPTGADQCVRTLFPSFCPPASGKSLLIFKSENQSAAALRARTIAMVAQCQVLFAFPNSPATWWQGKGSGTWLAVFQATMQNKQVFVHMPFTPLSQFPACHNIIGWSHVPGTALPQMSINGTVFAYPQTSNVFLNLW